MTSYSNLIKTLRLSCTFFEILSVIFQKLKRLRDSELELALFNPHTKFEMSTITCNEDMKGNARCKRSLV